jgi:hypothetical protein
VVPPETVLAMVAHPRAPYELMWLPISQSDSPEERSWTEVEKRFLDLTLYGLPEAFRRDDASPPSPPPRGQLPAPTSETGA